MMSRYEKIACPTFSPEGLKSFIYPEIDDTPYITIVEIRSGKVADVYALQAKYKSLEKLLEMLEKEKVTSLILNSVSRTLLEKLQEKGIKVYCAPTDLRVSDVLSLYQNAELSKISLKHLKTICV